MSLVRNISISIISAIMLASCTGPNYAVDDIVIYSDLGVKHKTVRSIQMNRLAQYDFADDEILVRNPRSFKSIQQYQHVLLHELVHWTGHENRLNRFKTIPIHSLTEEAIAEEAALMLAQKLNVQTITKRSSAAYLRSHNAFSQKMSDIDMVLVRREAKRAVDYLMPYLEKNGFLNKRGELDWNGKIVELIPQ